MFKDIIGSAMVSCAILGFLAFVVYLLPNSLPDSPAANTPAEGAAGFPAPVRGSFWVSRADISPAPFADPIPVADAPVVYTVTDTRPGWVQVAPVICHEGCNLGPRKDYTLSEFRAAFIFKSNP